MINDCGCVTPATIVVDPVDAICENELISLTATLGGSATMVTWTTGGDGTFDNINGLNPTYTPGVGDIANGSVELIATTDDPDGTDPCLASSSTVIAVSYTHLTLPTIYSV